MQYKKVRLELQIFPSDLHLNQMFSMCQVIITKFNNNTSKMLVHYLAQNYISAHFSWILNIDCVSQYEYILEQVNKITKCTVVVVQSLSHVWICDLWTVADQASLSFTISQSLLKLICIDSMMQPNPLILFFSFSFCLQSIWASGYFPKN